MVAKVREWYDPRELERKRAEETLDHGMKEWNNSGALLNREQVERIRRWLPDRVQQDQERELLRASEEHYIEEERKEASRKKLKKISVYSAAAGGIIVSLLLIVALYGWRQAELQRVSAHSRQLAADSLAHRDTLDLSLLLGIEASKEANTAEAKFDARNALFTGLVQYPRIEMYLQGQTGEEPLGARYARLFGLAVSPNGAVLATVSNSEKGVTLRDSHTGKVLRVLGRDAGRVAAVAFSRDGKVLVSGGDDHRLRIWDPSNGKALGTSAEMPPLEEPASVTAVAFGSSRDIVYSAAGNTLSMWNWRNATPVRAISTPQLRTIERAFISGGDKYAVISGFSAVKGHDNDRVTVWIDLATGLQDGDPKRGDAIASSPSGKLVALSQPIGVQVYDIDSHAPVGTFMPAATSDPYWDAATFSYKEDRLATSRETKIQLWDWKTGRAVGEPWSGHIKQIDALVFDPDGPHLTSLAADDSAIYWRVANERSLASQFAPTEEEETLAFSPTSPTLVSVGEKTTTLLDTVSGKVSARLPPSDLSDASAVFSANGRLLLLSSNQYILRKRCSGALL